MLRPLHGRASKPRSPSPLSRGIALAAVFTLVIAARGGGDWLVTQYGDEIETQGGWRIEDGWVYFTTADDREDLLPVEDIDLEASERATATRITLYVTAWCGYCRAARELLQDLDAEFEEKDVEQDEQAFEEHRALTGDRWSVPLLKTGRRVVRGFDAAAIEAAAYRQKNWKPKSGEGGSEDQ